MDLPIPAIAHTCGIQITVHDNDLSYLDKPYSFKYLHDLSNVENDHGNDDSFAVLIPRDSHLVTIFIDGGGGTTMDYHRLPPDYRGLPHITTRLPRITTDYRPTTADYHRLDYHRLPPDYRGLP